MPYDVRNPDAYSQESAVPFIEINRDVTIPRRSKIGFLNTFKTGMDSIIPYLGLIFVGIVVAYAFVSGSL